MLTTLIVASAFSQARTALQNIVDRVVKPAPDPIKSLQAMGQQIRSFVELIDTDELTRKALVDAVAAFDASGGAVYLMEDGRFRQVHVQGQWDQVEGMAAWLESGRERYGWIGLGPRRSGHEYTEQDRAILGKVGAWPPRR